MVPLSNSKYWHFCNRKFLIFLGNFRKNFKWQTISSVGRKEEGEGKEGGFSEKVDGIREEGGEKERGRRLEEGGEGEKEGGGGKEEGGGG